MRLAHSIHRFGLAIGQLIYIIFAIIYRVKSSKLMKTGKNIVNEVWICDQ